MKENSFRVWGVLRERVFSPGKQEADAAVLRLVLKELEARGGAAKAMAGETLGEAIGSAAHRPDVILAMCQGEPALRALETHGRKHAIGIVNTPAAIRNCYRYNTLALFSKHGIAHPSSWIVSREGPWSEGAQAAANGPWWLKRIDFHATESADVLRGQGRRALADALEGFRARGFERAVLQRHVPGPSVKFYGVGGGAFFAAYPEGPLALSPWPEGALRDLAEQAAAACGLEVYGGDAIIDPEGNLSLIDLNDWPSFQRCSQEAARAIAARVLKLLGQPKRARREDGAKRSARL